MANPGAEVEAQVHLPLDLTLPGKGLNQALPTS